MNDGEYDIEREDDREGRLDFWAEVRAEAAVMMREHLEDEAAAARARGLEAAQKELEVGDPISVTCCLLAGLGKKERGMRGGGRICGWAEGVGGRRKE